MSITSTSSRVRAIIDRIDPFSVSGHLAWSTHEGEYLNDLLPLPYDEETLALLARHVDEVQEGLGRPYLVENPSSYIGFAGSTMTEVEFLSELVRRTGCRLLVRREQHPRLQPQHGLRRPRLRRRPAGRGRRANCTSAASSSRRRTGDGDVFVDTHSDQIDDASWDLYAYVLDRFGPRPTLIEWDNDLPDFATLMGEAAHADAVADLVFGGEKVRAAG